MSGVTTNTVMRNFLVISDCFPQPDQASGDLRFFTLLSLLARKHKLLFCALNADGTIQPHDLIPHLKGAHEILKPGGQYLMAVPHRWFGPWDISKVFKYEVASGMHLKEYTHRELRQAVLSAGFRQVTSVQMPLHSSSEPARANAPWLRRICLMEAIFSHFARPILSGRMANLAKRAGIAPLIFLAATK